MTDQQREFARHLRDPVLFAQVFLGDRPWWPVQIDIARAVDKPRARVAIKGCHSSSKTYTMAQLVLWFIVRYPDGVVITTAPSDRQVKEIMWGEIRQAHARCRLSLPAPKLEELRKGSGNYALGFTTNNRDEAVRVRGFKAPHMLWILDEATGIPAEIFQAIEGAAAGGDVRVVMLGNPSNPGGTFYEAFTTNRANWTTFTIDAFDTPNFEKLRQIAATMDEKLEPKERRGKEHIVRLLEQLPPDHPAIQFNPRPYLVTPLWALERLSEWGTESPLWEWKVRGQFPTQAEDALISLAWIDAAREPKPAPDESSLYAGIDVAAGGADETVCAVRTEKGRVVAWGSWYGHSTGPVIDFLRPYQRLLEEINYDSAGPGEYFDTALEAAGFSNLNAVNVGESSDFPERFQNLKAHLYWILRERFKEGSVSGIDDELMISQLASLRFEINPRGRVEMESKAEMKKRGLHSPDRAEALMLAFANQTPGMLEHIKNQAERGEREFEYQKAVVEARVEGNPMPEPLEPEADVDDLIRIYNSVLYASDPDNQCARCGRASRGTMVQATNGKTYHPECEPR